VTVAPDLSTSYQRFEEAGTYRIYDAKAFAQTTISFSKADANQQFTTWTPETLAESNCTWAPGATGGVRFSNTSVAQTLSNNTAASVLGAVMVKTMAAGRLSQ
jgi:hypothetical protein